MIGQRYGHMLTATALSSIAFSAILVLSAWAYTTTKLVLARSEGVYPSAEAGMLARVDRAYVGVSRADIRYAGPNSFDGSQPHIWYVIAEVHASKRAGGSEMGMNDCDAPGSFFLDTTDGWVHVPEGAFPELVGFWMKVFGLAGPGRPSPSTNLSPTQPSRMCQSG